MNELEKEIKNNELEKRKNVQKWMNWKKGKKEKNDIKKRKKRKINEFEKKKE